MRLTLPVTECSSRLVRLTPSASTIITEDDARALIFTIPQSARGQDGGEMEGERERGRERERERERGGGGRGLGGMESDV